MITNFICVYIPRWNIDKQRLDLNNSLSSLYNAYLKKGNYYTAETVVLDGNMYVYFFGISLTVVCQLTDKRVFLVLKDILVECSLKEKKKLLRCCARPILYDMLTNRNDT